MLRGLASPKMSDGHAWVRGRRVSRGVCYNFRYLVLSVECHCRLNLPDLLTPEAQTLHFRYGIISYYFLRSTTHPHSTFRCRKPEDTVFGVSYGPLGSTMTFLITFDAKDLIPSTLIHTPQHDTKSLSIARGSDSNQTLPSFLTSSSTTTAVWLCRIGLGLNQ